MAAAATKSVGFLGQLSNSMKRFVFRMSGYNQYGLFHDDCLYENDDVKEALRRLPQNLKDDRHYRMHRAIHLSMTKTVLPKDEWFSYEEDHTKGRYLQPYLQEVITERKEREEWNKK
ncbi:putative cytochrome b-c1 complex subunit 7 [Penaeus vannamei]|uniref:Cytochrome b-c1 complex subunit 7 n=1 Tax=Penaeus vannamei TaxID=6689 RepID=A0A3R7MKT6_PENVA|nr:cytochrome b-c1 complex subunit 7-like [Penaeus vannamei]ROT79376.1 putative cytochrome b-c1 complex subunit 7 [Penaeus vannamei]